MTKATRTALAAALLTLTVALSAGPASAQETVDLAQELATAAQQAHEAAAAGVAMGTATPEEVYRWSLRWMKAETTRDRSSSVSQASAHLARMQALDSTVQQAIAGGMMTPGSGAAVRYYLAEARLLAKEAAGG